MSEKCAAKYCRRPPHIVVNDGETRKMYCETHWGEHIDAQYAARIAQLRGGPL